MSDPLDLDAESRHALEFDGLLAFVASYARSALGADRVRAAAPQADPAALAGELELLEEALGHHQSGEALLAGGLPDPRPALDALAVEQAPVAARALRDLAAVLAAAAAMRRALRALAPDGFPRLRELGDGVPDLRAEFDAVLRHVDAEGAIADGASPELASIRSAMARLTSRLRRMLETRLRSPESEGVIRDDFVTQRNGRFVLPVRIDAPRRLSGIVHASSSSGATLFVEPMETVGLNNELVELAEQEQEEQERILRDWADGFRRRREDVARAVRAVARIDALEARARFAEAFGGIVPRVAAEGPLALRAVRHPLLEARLDGRGGGCVPLDLGLKESERVLVLSGPNAGGKTVALKTVGLAVLMAQSAIPIPAAEARLPTFRQVRADIGDHQSIQADLSTFSAHLKALAGFLSGLRPPALLLFDELGTGTEPGEGAAMARAVLEELSRPGVRTVATTHHGALKAWAFTFEGAASAAMEFDPVSLRPTFRVLPGAAGVSAGLDMAERLGLDSQIVERARGYLGDQARQADLYLGRLRELSRELEQRRDGLAAQSAEFELKRREVERHAEQERSQRARELEKAIERELESFRRRARRELEGIRGDDERARAERRHRRAERRVRAEGSRLRSLLAAGPGDAAAERPLTGRVRPGLRVRVRALGQDGEVVSVRGDRVEVRVGSMTVAASPDELAAARAAPSAPAAPRSPSAAGREPLDDVLYEIKLLGMTVDEAIAEVDKRLDAAALAGRGEVRVVHGHGTGRLRGAVRRFLDGHPHVDGQRPGRPAEGGDGATIVRLK